VHRRPELLAPAGDWDALRAAVANGADAFYFGLLEYSDWLHTGGWPTEVERRRTVTSGFLLKFQEEAHMPTDSPRTAKTKTAVEKERPDEGLVVPLAATKTVTEVKREQPDPDPSGRSFLALPR
jgi:hypothetical protein